MAWYVAKISSCSNLCEILIPGSETKAAQCNAAIEEASQLENYGPRGVLN